jgi:hypothetical protein
MDGSSGLLVVRHWDVVITRAIAERCSPVIRNPLFNIEGDQTRVNTGALRGLALRTQLRWRASRDLDWSYGRRYPRSRSQRDRRSRFDDQKSRQSYREWARRRSRHHHHRKSAAFREQMRVRRRAALPRYRALRSTIRDPSQRSWFGGFGITFRAPC